MKNKKYIIRLSVQFLSIAVIVILDWLIKNIATEKLQGKGVVEVIPGFIGLYYCENTGAAFSLFSSSTMVLSIVTLVILVAAAVYMALPKSRPVAYTICLPCIIAGGLGNLIDRFARGYVIDYIMTLFVSFPVFNFADCFITCGCIALFGYLFFEIGREAKLNKKSEAAANGEKTDD